MIIRGAYKAQKISQQTSKCAKDKGHNARE